MSPTTKSPKTSKPTTQTLSLRGRALGYLSRREHSRKELSTKLTRHVAEGDDLPALLDDLERRKLLSDERFAESRTHSLKARYGSRRVADDLRSRGVSKALVAQAVTNAQGDELARAKVIWTRRFGTPPADALERAKHMRFLSGRGFSFDIIRQVVGSSGHGDENDESHGSDVDVFNE